MEVVELYQVGVANESVEPLCLESQLWNYKAGNGHLKKIIKLKVGISNTFVFFAVTQD